jgi:Uma2 family endonuclease
MAAPAPIAEPEFDPLVEFAGMWNTRLADRYLPIPDLPGVRYECVDGRLIMTPSEGFSNAYGESQLITILGPAARAAGLHLTTAVNLVVSPGTWIQPDVTILHTLPRDDHEDIWVPAELCTMVVEFVSPSSRLRDRFDKPALCAAAGIPYYMRVELVRKLRHVSVALLKLDDGSYREIGDALSGKRFRCGEPFPIEFAPEDLLY